MSMIKNVWCVPFLICNLIISTRCLFVKYEKAITTDPVIAIVYNAYVRTYLYS